MYDRVRVHLRYLSMTQIKGYPTGMILFLLILGACTLVRGLPNGPPLGACTSMQPGTRPGQTGMEGHLTAPQNEWPTHGNTRTPPFYIQIHLPKNDQNHHEYSPGQQIKISFVANQTYGIGFYKGLFAQVRRTKCADNDTAEVEDEQIGSFILPASADTLLKGINCNDLSNSAVGHYSPQFKINETVTWRAPQGNAGNLIVKATFVHYAHIYWTEVFSFVLRDTREDSPPICGSSHLSPAYFMTIFVTIVTIIQRLA